MGISRRVGALALAGLVAAFVAGCGETPPPVPTIAAPAVSADQLVGKWGLASYHKDEDRTRTIKEATAQCNKPYVINKGPNGGLMMYLAELQGTVGTFPEGRAKRPDLPRAARRRGHGGRSHRHQCRREFVHDDLGRSGQRVAVWNHGL